MLVTHQVLNEQELAAFRTGICPSYQKGYCPKGEKCKFSHCMTWPRRNPMVISYSPSYCLFIQFVRRHGRTCLLKNHCKLGRRCLNAHTKDEQMYHPDLYKTQLCKFYPPCLRSWCPFAHGERELRRVLLLHPPPLPSHPSL
eukprot:Platyproteum_vivax@DN15039_c0_g1_i1.p1